MTGIWRDGRARAWCVVVALTAVAFGVPVAGPIPLTWVAWLLLTAAHVAFVVEAWPIVRGAATPGHTRRIWRGLLASVLIFLVGDVVQLVSMPLLPWTPAVAIGVPAQGALVVLGVAVIVVTTVADPLRLGTARERWRFWLDVGVILTATSALLLYTVPPERLTGSQLVVGLVTGPGIFCVGAFAVVKLTLMPDRPFSRAAGRLIVAGAVSQGVFGNVLNPADPRHLPWAQGFSVIGSMLLALSARAQRTGAGAVERPAGARARRFSVLPYVAAVAANGLLVHSLHAYGLTRTTWLVVIATVLANVLVVARQLLALSETSQLLDTLDRRVGELHEALGQRDELALELQHLAFHDPLTGLANRALFTRRLAQAVAVHRHGVPGPPLALVLIDLDGFKLVNDRHGHEAGDRVLVEVAQRLQACAQPGDLVARLGGDEFVVLLEASAEEARAVADRAVQAVALPLDAAHTAVTVGASAGVALLDPGRDDPDGDDLLRRADAAMYAAKHGGKGRSAVHAVAGG